MATRQEQAQQLHRGEEVVKAFKPRDRAAQDVFRILHVRLEPRRRSPRLARRDQMRDRDLDDAAVGEAGVRRFRMQRRARSHRRRSG